MTTSGKEKTMAKGTLFSNLALLVLVLSGCGGAADVVPLSVPVNKAIVLSSALKPGLSNSSLPIRGYTVSFVIPANVAPVLNVDGSLLIGETGLNNLKILASQGNIPAGNFDPLSRKVQFDLWPNNALTSDLGVGDLARLTYTSTSGAELTAQEIEKTLTYVVSGPGSADLSSEIVPAARIVTYQKP
jgi:hypothetical protein